jgi:hypothetical protein
MSHGFLQFSRWAKNSRERRGHEQYQAADQHFALNRSSEALRGSSITGQ